MHHRIKNILPEYVYGYEGFEQLNANITYIFDVKEKDYHIVYELEDFFNNSDIRVIYRSKLREDDTNAVYIDSNYNGTGTPRGLVVNVNQINADKLEKKLLIFSILQDTKWSVTKIDNNQALVNKKLQQEELFNSLFTIE